MKEHKLDNLPNWARQEIEKLRGDITYYKKKAEEIKGDRKTNTYIGTLLDKPIPLPNNSRVIFVTHPDRGINTEQIQVKVTEDNEIEIYGSRQLNIKCQSSNVCTIKQEDR